MIKFYFKKLVRDKVVSNCQTDPEVLQTSYRVLDENEYRHELIKKLFEEAAEIPSDRNSPRHEVISEIADLQNVIDAVCDYYGVSKDEVRKAGDIKSSEKGGFSKRHYIDHVILAKESKWIAHFRSQPDKYKEES